MEAAHSMYHERLLTECQHPFCSLGSIVHVNTPVRQRKSNGYGWCERARARGAQGEFPAISSLRLAGPLHTPSLLGARFSRSLNDRRGRTLRA
jgi:hypothetical protein